MDGHELEMISVDNCCNWRKQLQNIFGRDVPVKLDLFHAVKRVSQAIPKNMPLRKEVVRQLRQVFRLKNDCAVSRLQPTPSTEEVMQNFQAFRSEMEEVVSKEVRDAFNSLQLHIRKGCLSNVPAGCGTNRNERLHRLLNKSALCVGRIGPQLAEALLAGIFFRWNEVKMSGLFILPVPQYPSLHEKGTSVVNTTPGNSMSGPTANLPTEINPNQRETRVVQRRKESMVEMHDLCHALFQAWVSASAQTPMFCATMTPVKFAASFLNGEYTFRSHAIWSKIPNPDELHGMRLAPDPVAQLLPNRDSPHGSMSALQEWAQQQGRSTLTITTSSTLPFLLVSCDVMAKEAVTFVVIVDAGKTVQVHRIAECDESTMDRNPPDDRPLESLERIGKGCRCGDSATKSATVQSCTTSATYKSRCPCFRNNRPCGLSCKCRSCNNPHGARAISMGVT